MEILLETARTRRRPTPQEPKRQYTGPRYSQTAIERDPRCKMISLDPDTGEHDPQVLRKVAHAHDNLAGVYCAVPGGRND